MTEPFIELRNLTRVYQEGEEHQVVLNRLCLKVERGERVALLGRSGSGKSTLLNLISGIDSPDAGSVRIEGVELTARPERERTLFRRRHIGFIYQFFNLIPSLTALENIQFVLELNDIVGAEVAERSDSMLARVGLSHKADRFPSQRSGGEQQRIALARALVHRPRIVLADEPTGNLDARTGAAMLDVLDELLSGNDSSLFIVTHSLAVARTAHRILTLEDGELAEQEPSFAW